MDANVESLDNLRINLKEQGYNLDKLSDKPEKRQVAGAADYVPLACRPMRELS
jgi:hypothetical protein